MSIPEATSLAKAALVSLRAQAADPVTRLAARLTRDPSSRLWTWAYARSTDRFSALTRFIATHPRAMAEVAKALASRCERDNRQDLVLSWLLNLMARFQLAIESGDRAEDLVIDEGFCQRAVALFAYGFSPREDLDGLKLYLDAVPTPDAVVVVETPLEECEARLDRRGWSERVIHLDREGRREFLANALAIVQAVVGRLEASGVHVLSVNGSSPEQETVHNLAHNLS